MLRVLSPMQIHQGGQCILGPVKRPGLLRASDRSSLACGVWYPPDATGPREDLAALVLWNGLGLSWPPIDRAWREACGVSYASSREVKANRNAGKKGHFSEAPDRPDRLASMRDLAPLMLQLR